jgi:flagellar basal body P-ring protein FlgI
VSLVILSGTDVGRGLVALSEETAGEATTSVAEGLLTVAMSAANVSGELAALSGTKAAARLASGLLADRLPFLQIKNKTKISLQLAKPSYSTVYRT